MKTTQPTQAPHRGMAALDLAEAFLVEYCEFDRDEANQVRTTILDAALLISELSGPGHWEAFDAREYVQRIDFRPPHAIVGECLHLAGFFGWLALSGLMELTRAGHILRDIKAAVPHEPLLHGLCNAGLDNLQAFAEIEIDRI